MAARPYDLLPDQLKDKTATASTKPTPSADVAKQSKSPAVPMDVQTTAYMTGAQDAKQPVNPGKLEVPETIPGSEAPLITLPADPVARQQVLRNVYKPLDQLREEVKPLPGPGGKPYTLSDFQRIAAENSPTLRQAASDVQAARGNLLQSTAYPNPNVAIAEQASNNNSTGGAVGGSIDQQIVIGGKLKLAAAAAQKQLDNSELALRRARSDLATQVRNAYYALLVSKETMRVTRALAVLTDEVYQVQLTLTEKGGFNAAYEPAALRAQAYAARLAYVQSIQTYVYNWKQLVATIGVRQLPLSEVDGRIDAVVPHYEYDRVLAQVLTTHTDTLTARNGIDYNRYNLKAAQIAPWTPNLDVNVGMYKDRVLYPIGTYHTFTVTAPIPIWDQNRGNIFAAEAALARALEEPHRVELVLTNNLANVFTNYKTNLDAVEYYRRYILPDQVRFYRGVLQRRQIDQGAQFGDLVAAQQGLATSVTTYLALLGSLWTSVVSVADLLQTDDLFQTAKPMGLDAIPDLDALLPLPCCHPFGQTGAGPVVKPAAGAGSVLLPGTAPAPAPAAPAPVPPMTPPAPIPPVGPRVSPFSSGALRGPPSVFFLFFCNAAAPPADVPPDPGPGFAPRVLPAGR
jgi:cobalt-zinc-cadmium efflux system outer membrane protein